MVFCAPSDRKAEELALEAFGWYILSSYKLFLAHSKGAGWQVLRDRERLFLEALEGRSREVFDYLREHNSIVVGSPERCIEGLRRYEALGVDRMLCLMQVRGIPLPAVRRSIELFGREVVPAFHGARQEAR